MKAERVEAEPNCVHCPHSQLPYIQGFCMHHGFTDQFYPNPPANATTATEHVLHPPHGSPWTYACSLQGISLRHVMAVVREINRVRILVPAYSLPALCSAQDNACSSPSLLHSPPATITLNQQSLISSSLSANSHTEWLGETCPNIHLGLLSSSLFQLVICKRN